MKPTLDRIRGVATSMLLLGAIATLGAVALAAFFYCPCSRLPGGYLLGDEQNGQVDDWSFANAVPLCQVEVNIGLPHSVNLNCMAHDGRLYLSCANCDGKRWSGAALLNPDARLRVNGTVYPVRLTRVEDPDELTAAWRARANKTGQPLDTPRAPGWWSFRVESRG